MNYKETLDYLYTQLPMFQRVGQVAYKANLDNTILLDNYFHSPHQKFASIHIAGTNGKGSVSHLLASILQEAGYKVGLYTSPHLKDFRERIKVNGEMISEDEVVGFVEKHRNFVETVQPSFFEWTVAMAFDYFERSKIDIAVVEVGLGGRLDSTNIISPVLSIITNISKDHIAILGDTLEQIAQEKGGIIKPLIPVVIGEYHEKTAPVFQHIADENRAPLVFASEKIKNRFSTIDISQNQLLHFEKEGEIYFSKLATPLLGQYQQKNGATVLCAVEELVAQGFKITDEAIYAGFLNVIKNTDLKGRWQIIGANPKIVCDTGHNEAGIKLIVEQLAQTPFQKLHIIIGVVNDKDVTSILKLLPKEAIYYFTKADLPRSLDEHLLQKQASEYGLLGNVYHSVSIAIENAKKNAGVNDLIFIGGSTFVVAEAI